jgi:hypothetical protein
VRRRSVQRGRDSAIAHPVCQNKRRAQANAASSAVRTDSKQAAS